MYAPLPGLLRKATRLSSQLGRLVFVALGLVGRVQSAHERRADRARPLANGEHPKRIQALMGHSSINVTMDVSGT
ncbi:MAG: hypothetical protein ACREXU_00420 [Gammaproteobacteria bacterium]